MIHAQNLAFNAGLDVAPTYAEPMKFVVYCVWFIINDVLVTTKELQSRTRKPNVE